MIELWVFLCVICCVIFRNMRQRGPSTRLSFLAVASWTLMRPSSEETPREHLDIQDRLTAAPPPLGWVRHRPMSRAAPQLGRENAALGTAPMIVPAAVCSVDHRPRRRPWKFSNTFITCPQLVAPARAISRVAVACLRCIGIDVSTNFMHSFIAFL